MAFNPKSILSVDVDGDTVIATELTAKRTYPSLVSYTITRSISDIVRPASASERRLVVGIPSQGLLFKSFPFNAALLKNRDRKKEITTFFSRQNLPLRLDDCFWYAFITPGFINLAATRKDSVEKILRQFSEAGFSVSGVVPAFMALLNLFIYTYGDREKAILVHVRAESSDLLLYENKRIWVYPVPGGRQKLSLKASMTVFVEELRRIISTHYLQNPQSSKVRAGIYISGLVNPSGLIDSLKSAFTDYDVYPFEPLKKIPTAREISSPDAALLALSLGLGLSSCDLPGIHKVNLIGEKVKSEQFVSQINFVEKVVMGIAVCAFMLLLMLNVRSLMDVNDESARVRETGVKVSDILPQIKSLKAEKARLEKTKNFLQQKLDSQSLYLKALAAIAENISPVIETSDFEAKVLGAKMEVYVGGKAANYDSINQFLVKLKGRKDVHDVKIVASALPSEAVEGKTIDFKLRFDIKGSDPF